MQLGQFNAYIVIDVFYKLIKSKLGAQYDPKIGMLRSNCLKVYGMSISYQVLHNIFCGFMDILEHIFNCYIVEECVSAVKNRIDYSQNTSIFREAYFGRSDGRKHLC